MAIDTAAELRKIVTEIRRTPIRLDTWNPAILKAADEIDALRLHKESANAQCRELSKEIDALRAENERLREALKRVRDMDYGGAVNHPAKETARAALEGK